jgi:hypothetical protein
MRFTNAFTFVAGLVATTSFAAACETCEEGSKGVAIGTGVSIAIGAHVGVITQVHTVVDVLAHLKTELTNVCAPFRAFFSFFRSAPEA